MGLSKKKLVFENLGPCKCVTVPNKIPDVLDFQDAPHYLKFNPYITGGYRSALGVAECVQSWIRLTNETVNIWTHLLGWVFFFTLTVYDVFMEKDIVSWKDYTLTLLILFAFQACMLLSSLYHTFCCCSAVSYRRWLTLDLFGVSLSLLAIYVSGIYYAFSCEPSGFWFLFYEISVILIFVFALIMQVLPVKDGGAEDGFQWRLFVFGGWAAYGVVPTLHWVTIYGFQDPMVQMLLPRIVSMYVLSILAFVFYVSRFPERLFPGKLNYFGSSHQIWHILIFVALFHWHRTGVDYASFNQQYQCGQLTEF